MIKMVYHRTSRDVAISRPLNLIDYPLESLVPVSKTFSLALLNISHTAKRKTKEKK